MMQSRQFSSSTSRALSIAGGRARTRKADRISSLDLLVGVFRSHGDTSEPAELLAHAGIPLENLDRRLENADGGFGASGNLRPGTVESSSNVDFEPDLESEASSALEVAGSLAEKFAREGSGAIRLRDLFGGLLLEDNAAARLLGEVLAASFVTLDDVRETYPTFLEWRETAQPYREFLAEHHPPPHMPVSGFSADTIADQDFVGIGPEVNAMAYLISAKSLAPPLAIGLFGDWGSGKSFFMRALQARIERITGDARKSGRPQRDIDVFKHVVQIEFNAWHYVEGELWASLVEHILRNLQTGGDTPSELRARQQVWIDRIRRAQGEDTEIRRLRDALEKELAQANEKLVHAQRDLERKRQDLATLSLDELLEAADLPGEVEHQAQELCREAGLGDVTRSFGELAAALEESRDLWRRGNAVLAPLRAPGTPRLAWVASVAVIALVGPLVSLALDSLGQGISTLSQTLAALGSMAGTAGAGIAAANGWVSAHLAKAEKAAERLAQYRHRAEKQYAERVAELRAQQQTLEDGLAAAREEAEQKQQELRELERELEGITPGRLLLDFINERVGSEDYRQHLGVAALIRRDFDKLSRLIAEHNERFVEQDDGRVEPSSLEDRHRINRIVLYIDDLDRCPPERVVQVLQAVHLLMAFPLFVVIVAVDSRWLSQSLQSHYDELLAREPGDQIRQRQATTDDYLEKIFQIPFWVRPLTEAARLRIVQGLVAGSMVADSDEGAAQRVAAGGVPQQVRWESDEAEQPLERDEPTDLTPRSLEITRDELRDMAQLRGLLGESPRSVKRFVNLYRLVKAGQAGRWRRFMENDGAAGFRVVLFLLAVVTGRPVAAGALLDVCEPGTDGTVGDLVRQRLAPQASDHADIAALVEWLGGPDAGRWAMLPAAGIAEWSDQVSRYAYRP